MREDDLPTNSSAQPEVELKMGGIELLPIVQPLWEALYDHHHENGDAGLAVRPREESWPLRFAHYEQIFKDHTAFAIVAHTAGVPSGYALAYEDDPIDEDDERSIVTVESLVLLPETRGQGIGTLLLAAVETEASERWEAAESALEVMTGNESADAFYEHAGFVERGETWLRLAPAGGPAVGERKTDEDRLGELLDEHLDDEEALFALALEDGPDDTWLTSDVLVVGQPEYDVEADAAALEAALAPFAAAGATSALIALDSETDAGWPEALESLGFRKVLRLLTRPIAAN